MWLSWIQYHTHILINRRVHPHGFWLSRPQKGSRLGRKQINTVTPLQPGPFSNQMTDKSPNFRLQITPQNSKKKTFLQGKIRPWALLNTAAITLVQQCQPPCQQRQTWGLCWEAAPAKRISLRPKPSPFLHLHTEDQHQMHKTLRPKCNGGSKAKEEGLELVQQGCWIPQLYSQNQRKRLHWKGPQSLTTAQTGVRGVVPVGLLSSVRPQVTGQVCRSRENLATVSGIRKCLIRQHNLQWLCPSLSCTGCTAQLESSLYGRIGIALVQQHLNKSIQQM